MCEALLKFENVSKSYGDFQVFNDVSVDVHEGEVVAIIGSSGSGKTTLLRCINLLEPFQSGKIILDGREIGYHEVDGKRKRFSEKEIAQQRSMTGMVFQQFNLFPHMTAKKNVMLGLIKTKKLPVHEAEAIAEKWLTVVGLKDKMDSLPGALSGGQQQRVAIARAVAMNPKILLFDEATSALDPELVGEVLNVIRNLAKEGATMILVTHEMRFAYEVADKIIFMDSGKIAAVGTPKEIFEDRPSPRLREFLSTFTTPITTKEQCQMIDYKARTHVEINLDFFQKNIQKVRDLVGPEVKVMQVLKADAYGHGIRMCSRYAEPLVDSFATATLEAALTVREQASEKPVLILGKLSDDEILAAAQNELSICLPSVEYAQNVQRLMEEYNLQIDGHLKIDTGMNRLGLRAYPNDIAKAVEDARIIYAIPSIRIQGKYTHYACAGTDDLEEIAFTEKQFVAFTQVCDTLAAQGYELGLRHTASTVAFLDHPEYRQDMVQTGMIPLGQCINEDRALEMGIKPILTWYAKIVDIHDLKPGESVSYGRIYRASGKERIAVIPVGYADGYFRSLSNIAEVIVHDKRVPIRGKLCMDYMMIDVTYVPNAKIGDDVILLGRSESHWISTDYLSELTPYGVNGYITANIGIRVPRVYVHGEEVVAIAEYQY